LKALTGMLKTYAQVLSAVAEIEEATGKKFDELLKEVFNPSKLAELHGKLPAEVYGELVAALLKLASISSNVPNPMLLPAEEKRKLSSQVLEIAESLEKAARKLGSS
jgi:F0F1-type ATP synthase delta subunit